jgi:D-amino-acid oxidase
VTTTKGQTVVVRTEGLLREFVVDMSSEESDLCYVLPRDDGYVVLGGTHTPSTSTDCDPAEASRIQRRAQQLVPALAGSIEGPSTRHWAGLRPERSAGIRMEGKSTSNGGVLVHNYGHGGAGFTLHHGCALEAVELLGLSSAGKKVLVHQRSKF